MLHGCAFFFSVTYRFPSSSVFFSARLFVSTFNKEKYFLKCESLARIIRGLRLVKPAALFSRKDTQILLTSDPS